MKIAFIGIGNMGLPMAERLLAADHQLTVYNRTRAKAEALGTQGVTLADSPAAAAEASELVITMLADDAAEEAVLKGEHGLLASEFSGVHVACTTLSVASAREFAARHDEVGQGYVSCPVLGRPDAAAAGKLWGLAGGRSSSVKRAKPALEAFTQRIFEIGEHPERANLAKLAMNFTLMAMVETLGEAYALAEKGGMSRTQFHEIVTGTVFNAPVYKNYGGMIAEHRYYPAGFAAPLGLKDMRLALAAGDQYGVPMPLAGLVRDGLVETLARGRADADLAALGAIASEHAGLKA